MLNTEIPYHFRESQKAKRIQIRLVQSGVEIIMPRGACRKKAYQFMCDKQSWIEKQWQKTQAHTQSMPYDVPLHYRTGAQLLYQGELVELSVVQADTVLPEVVVAKGKLCVLCPQYLDPAAEEKIQSIVEQFLTTQLAHTIEKLIVIYSQQLGCVPTGYAISRASTRWGSCTPGGKIRINRALIMVPSSVLAYVVVHELCHLKHPNHSVRFWNCVASVMPDYAEHKAWLKQNGALIDVLR